jgi:hypothetical protein
MFNCGLRLDLDALLKGENGEDFSWPHIALFVQ